MKRQIRGLCSWRLLPHWTIPDLSQEDASEPGLGSHLSSIVLTLCWVKFLLLLYTHQLRPAKDGLTKTHPPSPPLWAVIGGEISRKCKATTPFDHISSRCPRPGPHYSSARCHHWSLRLLAYDFAHWLPQGTLINSQKLSQPNNDPKSIQLISSWKKPHHNTNSILSILK